MSVVGGDLVDVEPQAHAALEIGGDHRDVLGAARHLETARARPVERLARVLGEAHQLVTRVPDELHHQVARARVAHEPGRAGRGLRRDVVPIEHDDLARAALDEVEGGGRAEPARADHDHVGATGQLRAVSPLHRATDAQRPMISTR